jgi:hypothetical protein
MLRAKRILLGTQEICRHLYDMSDAFRHLGYDAETILANGHPFTRDLHYDHPLKKSTLPLPAWIEQRWHPLIRRPRETLNRWYQLARLIPFLTAYDIYVFQWGTSLLPHNEDFPILKRLGKKIIVLFLGSDIRHWSATEPVRESYGMVSYPEYRNDAHHPLRECLSRLRMAERYADVIFAQPTYAELAVRPYRHVYLAVNPELYKSHVPGRDVPVVVHAPSCRGVKGTEEILATLDKLKAEGVAFELRLLENMPNYEVIRQLQNADVVIDELNEAHYGMLAMEGMATGCAVAGPNLAGGPITMPPDPPVLHINPAIVYSQLRRLLTDKSLRLQLAYAGRPFMEKHYNYLNVTANMLRCLDPKEAPPYDYFPEFFARDYHLPEGQVIDDNLKRLTAQIVQRCGLPKSADPQDMIARGLMSPDGLNLSRPIPRWNSAPPLPQIEMS